MKRNIIILITLSLILVSCSSPSISESGNPDSGTTNQQPNSFTVRFDSAGGTNINDQPVEEGNTIRQPVNPQKTGYTFQGWFYEDNSFDFSTPITSSITLTAKWTANRYTIVFDKTTGSGQDMQEEIVSYDEEKALYINSYNAPSGMKFAGWSTSRNSSSIIYENGQVVKNLLSENNSRITLYAVWIEETVHTIRYNNITFSGTTIDNSANPSTFYESGNVELQNLERRGYTFDGWFTDSNFSNRSKITGWNAGEKTTDIILYAKWTIIHYNITYEGLSGGISYPNGGNPRTYTIEDTWSLKSPQKNHYYFLGWKLGNNDIINISNAGGGDITITAQWELMNYDIAYYIKTPDGKERRWHLNTFTIEDDVTLLDDPKTSDSYYNQNFKGYDFSGWFDNSNYRGTPITGWNKGEKTTHVNVYGKFEPKTLSITFDPCGGADTFPSQTATYGNTYVTQPDDPVYNDYTFMGWYYDIEKTKPFDFSKKFMDTEDITLYGKWGIFVYVEGATVEKNLPETFYADGKSKESCFTGGGYITIPNLYVCDHEITQAEYTKFCKYSGTQPNANPYKPVSCVSLYDAIIYCNLRSIAEGLEPVYTYAGNYGPNWANNRDPKDWPLIVGNDESKYCGTNSASGNYQEKIVCISSANGYRLPTEAEWEFIAREGSPLSTYNYSGSNNCREVAWYADNSSGELHYGKCKKPNSLGIYDMTGNLTEICWQSRNTSLSSPVIDGYTITRGGSYQSNSYLEIDTADPSRSEPYKSLPTMGFRVVRTATE